MANNYIVMSVSTLNERDKIIRRIYDNLTKEPNLQFTIVQDQVNRIKIFHNTPDGTKILIRTYLVICLPIIIDLTPLYELYGSIDFNLDETINHLTKIIHKLQSMQGKRVVKGNADTKHKGILKSLSEVY